MRFLVFCTFCSGIAAGVFASEDESSFLDEYSPVAIEFICSKEVFLNRAGLDWDECRIVYSEADIYCREIAEPIEPESDFDELGVDAERRAESFAMLYSHCLHAVVLSRIANDDVTADVKKPDR